MFDNLWEPARKGGRLAERVGHLWRLAGRLRLGSPVALGYSPTPCRRRAGVAEGRAMLRFVRRCFLGLSCALTVATESLVAQQPLSAPPPPPEPPPVVDLTPAELPGR